MEQDDNVNNELEGITPAFPPKQSMSAPEGYFDTFPQRILNRWEKERSQPVKKSLTRNWIGIAAITTGLVIGGLWLFPTSSSNELREITAIEAYQYINENIDEFESLIESSRDAIYRVSAEPDELSGLPDDAVEEYLIDEMHGTDPEDLF